MRTRTVVTVVTAAAVIGLPLAAGAQVVIVPEPAKAPRAIQVPVPVPMPAPVVRPMPPMPPMPLLDLRGLEDLRVIVPDIQLNLPDIQMKLHDMKLDFDHNFRFEGLPHFEFQDHQGLMPPGQSDGNYSSGKSLMQSGKYDQAIVRFDRVIAAKGANVDGAMYWKAFSQYRFGKPEEALTTIATLRKEHPQSPYNADAKVLEADVRKTKPGNIDDDELKLLAIQAMQHTDPERAIPLLEGVLNATNSLRVKRQALYVLALSTQPRAHQILLNYAKGGGNPDLQIEAIRYFTANRNKQTTGAQLVEIYQATQNTDVKLAIISALRSSGNTVALANIVGSSPTPIAIRSSALNSLTGIMSPQELWSLYEKESNKDLKLQMVSAFGSMDAVDYLSRIIKSEKDPEIRRRAIRSLGNRRAEKTGQMLVDLYAGEQDVETRKTIISSLATQNNAEGLVAIARKEQTLALKTDIVRQLTVMAPKNKVAADYLMEMLKGG